MCACVCAMNKNIGMGTSYSYRIVQLYGERTKRNNVQRMYEEKWMHVNVSLMPNADAKSEHLYTCIHRINYIITVILIYHIIGKVEIAVEIMYRTLSQRQTTCAV